MGIVNSIALQKLYYIIADLKIITNYHIQLCSFIETSATSGLIHNMQVYPLNWIEEIYWT